MNYFLLEGTHVRQFRQMTVTFIAIAAAGLTGAQDAPVPKDISGRWTMQGTARTQTFAIEDITVNADRTFRAKLTWWTSDPKCLIKNEPIVGQLVEGVLQFEAKNRCDVSFTTKLSRTDNEWTGTATTTSGPMVVLNLKAN